jgi:tRNA modification GTPase
MWMRKTLEFKEITEDKSKKLVLIRNKADKLNRLPSGLNSCLSPDLLTVDIRKALHQIGEITGDITTDEILGSIFSRFCIGK